MSLQMLAQVAAESDGSPLAVGISIIAAGASVFAVVVSRQALKYAKGEPARSSQRALDDQLRGHAAVLMKSIKQLQTDLRFGRNISGEPTALETCREFLDELAQRRPDGSDAGRHLLTAVTLRALSSDWRAAVHNQERVDEDAAYLEQRRLAGDTNLADRNAQLGKDQRARDARYLEVKKQAELSLKALEGEIDVLNRRDRSAEQS